MNPERLRFQARALEEMGLSLLRPLFPPRRGVRLLGFSLSGFEDQAAPGFRQLALCLA